MDTQNYKRLLTGQPPIVRQWLAEYAHWLWSWLCFHTTGGPEQAGEALIKTFTDAIERLSEFPASGLSMSEWLRAFAKKAGGQTQAPERFFTGQGAEDQLIRIALVHLATEPLSGQIFSGSGLNRIVAAALLELDKDQMELLTMRYSRLDTVRRIAAETGTSPELLGVYLYRARHSFQRVLQNIASIQMGDKPASAGVQGVDILEENLEKLLCSVSPVSPVPGDIYHRLEEIVEKSSEQLRQTYAVKLSGRRRILTACAAAAVLLLSFAIWLVWPAGREGKNLKEESPARTTAVKNKREQPQTKPDRTSADQEEDITKELKQALEMGEAGDADGLVNMLWAGGLPGQLVAARYLAEYGDQAAIDALDYAAANWGGEQGGENPFIKAIEAIEGRLAEPQAKAARESTPPENKTTAAIEKEKEKTGIILKGRVSGTDNKGMAGIKITLSGWSLGRDLERKNLSQTLQTDQNGDFQARIESEGFVRLELKDRPADAPVLVRSFFCQADVPEVKADFGTGLPAYGSVIINGEPLVDAELFAAEVCGPENSGFLARCRTDGQGGFRFVGLLPGHYAVFYVRKWAGQDVSIVLGELRFGRDNRLDVVTADAAIEIFSDGQRPVLQSDANSLTLRTAGGFRGHAVSTAKTEPNEPYWFEDVPSGVYEVEIPLDGGVYWYEPIEITREIAIQHFRAELPAQRGFAQIASVQNRSAPFCVWSRDRRIRGVLEPMGEKERQLALPPGLYSAGALLTDDPAARAGFEVIEGGTTDIELSLKQSEYAQRGLLTVYVTDANCNLLSGALLRLQGREFIETQSKAQGVCFGVWAGPYILQAEMEGFVSWRETVEIAPADVLADGLSVPVKVIRLERP